MTGRGWMMTMAAAALAMLSSATVAADPPRPGGSVAPGGPPAHEDKERWRGQIMDQLRGMRMWKLTEELKLDEATAAKLFPLLSKYDDLEREVHRERGHAYRELHQALEAPSPDRARIDAVVEKMARLRDRRHVVEQEKLAAVRKVLTAQQMGKLLLVIPRIEDSFRRKIREAIDSARGGAPERRHRRDDDRPAPL